MNKNNTQSQIQYNLRVKEKEKKNFKKRNTFAEKSGQEREDAESDV